MALSRLHGLHRLLRIFPMETTVQPNAIKIRGIDDVIAYLDSRKGINGRAGVIWWLALGGFFLTRSPIPL
jgi:hypothetical protein